jgi:hypothetical protein
VSLTGAVSMAMARESDCASTRERREGVGFASIEVDIAHSAVQGRFWVPSGGPRRRQPWLHQVSDLGAAKRCRQCLLGPKRFTIES